ncbi:unnamed protein product [Spirodela intermedia]|uniref:Uncharacterized protein n=1 Tax=Spirodela intermedia TaxID=51605 RepID=A0A7I8KYA3_SPIIN|nr:unnamed protein product [Spirodela intermedia]
MEKTPDEIYNLYENLSENSRDQASFELYDRDKKRGIYELHHDDDSKLRNEINEEQEIKIKILQNGGIRRPAGPASGSEAQSGGVAASRGSSGLLGSIGARVRHSPSTMKLPNTRLTSIQPLSVG